MPGITSTALEVHLQYKIRSLKQVLAYSLCETKKLIEGDTESNKMSQSFLRQASLKMSVYG